MYERSAIVLERYFNSILGYSSENNLKVNFENYCSLVEKLTRFKQCFEQEQISVQEFQDVTERLKTIQKNQEKLYKKNAKLEFNRNILFNNIDEKPEETEFCMLKIEHAIEKNIEDSKNLRIDFITTLKEYNEKNKILNKNKKQKRDAEKLYAEALELTEENIDNINEFVVELARDLNGEQIREKIVKLMIDNGKNEKIPFDENVINLAVDLGIDIAQKEAQCYVDIYDTTQKLFEEIENNDVKIDKYQRKMRNARVKLNFLFAEKEYLVQFLDYERMTSVSGKRIHKKLMLQACENFRVDLGQIANLYELVLKEIVYKATKKIYKELYNKSYLLEINKQEETFKKEKNKLNLNVGTVLGSNYWRIEGIKNIYTVFYKDMSEVFGRSLDEFDVPDEEDDDLEIDYIEEVEEETPLVVKATVKKKESTSKKKKLETIEKIEKIEEEILEEIELPQLLSDEVEEIVTEAKVKRGRKPRVKKQEVEIIEKVEIAKQEEKYFEEEPEKIEVSKVQDIEDIPYEEDSQEYEIEEEEESLFGNIKNSKSRNDISLEILEQLEESNRANKKGIFESLIKMNTKKGKRAAN